MNRIVFLGPTLPIEAAKAELDAIYLPPVAQGDIYRAIARQPAQIGIVDGYFDFVPAVWHKEILLALAQGIRVFGSASTGALRAAELWRFGMEGVGRIFEAFRDGMLEDDDEVALIHAPQELGYLPLSEPMVTIRATLDRSVELHVISAHTSSHLLGIAKRLFYQERSWPNVFARAKEQDASEAELTEFSAFLPAGRVDQKRLDALDMLRAMRDTRSSPQPVAFHLEETWLSEAAQRASLAQPSHARRDPVLDPLRLRGKEWRALYRRALTTLAQKSEARRQGAVVREESVIAALHRIRYRQDLNDAVEIDQWLAINDLDHASLVRLTREGLQVAAIQKGWDASVESELSYQLKVAGNYGELNRRRALSQELGRYAPADEELVGWYVRTRLGGRPPIDLLAHAYSIGFPDVQTLLETLRCEWALERCPER